jgi:sialidase-1
MKQSRRGFLFGALGTSSAVALATSSGKARRLNDRFSIRPQYVAVYGHSEYSCSAVNLERLHNGDLVASFCQALEDHHTGDILLVRSKDQGRNWTASNPVTIFSRNDSARHRPGYHLARITQLSDGSLISVTTEFRFLFEKSLAWRRGTEIEGVYVSFSQDGGHAWTEKTRVNRHPFHVAWARGPVLEMEDGALLLPLSGLQGDRYHALDEPIISILLRSNDRGVTWDYHSTMAFDPTGLRDYDEASVVRLRDGRLLCMLRSHERPRRDPEGGYLYQTFSEDGGKSWSDPVKTMLWGHAADLVQLQDGRVLCTYGYPMLPNPGIRGCVSEDGRHWESENIFVIKSVPSAASQCIQIGSPASVQFRDGTILTAYHAHGLTPKLVSTAPVQTHIEGALYQLGDQTDMVSVGA